jgi:hypothetical protein
MVYIKFPSRHTEQLQQFANYVLEVALPSEPNVNSYLPITVTEKTRKSIDVAFVFTCMSLFTKHNYRAKK